MHLNEIQQQVNWFLERLGNDNYNVLVNVDEAASYLAQAVGAKVFNKPIGQINLDSRLIDIVTRDELKFVLGHEVVHIDQNHIVSNALFRLPKALLKALESDNEDARTIRILWDLARTVQGLAGEKPIEAKVTRANEHQADIWSIWLNHDADAAISCLRKLVGGDLEQPSHTWEAFDYDFPAMTMRQRIEDIRRSLAQYPQLPNPTWHSS